MEAHAAGKGTLVELAERFGVSAGWAWKISAAQAQTGSAARTPQGRRPSAVDAELVRRLVKQKPDIVLRELEEGMREHGQAVSRTQLWRVLKKLGLRLKKSRSTPPSGTRNITAHAARPSSKPFARHGPKT